MAIPDVPPLSFFERHRRTIWWTSALLPLVFFLGITLVSLVERQWFFAFDTLIFAGCSVLWTYMGVNNFRYGYRRGMDAFAEAIVRAESKEELLRLTVDAPPPKPWE